MEGSLTLCNTFSNKQCEEVKFEVQRGSRKINFSLGEFYRSKTRKLHLPFRLQWKQFCAAVGQTVGGREIHWLFWMQKIFSSLVRSCTEWRQTKNKFCRNHTGRTTKHAVYQIAMQLLFVATACFTFPPYWRRWKLFQTQKLSFVGGRIQNEQGPKTGIADYPVTVFK